MGVRVALVGLYKTSEIDNLGLTTADANQAKGSLSLEEFIILCIDVLENFGIIEITEET